MKRWCGDDAVMVHGRGGDSVLESCLLSLHPAVGAHGFAERTGGGGLFRNIRIDVRSRNGADQETVAWLNC